MNRTLWLVSFLIVAMCAVKGWANSVCQKDVGAPPHAVRIVEVVCGILFDIFLLLDVVIIGVAVWRLWRARLFTEVREMRSNKCMLILFTVLLSIMLLDRIYFHLEDSQFSNILVHIISFILTCLIEYIVFLTNRPPKTLKSTPLSELEKTFDGLQNTVEES